MLNNLASVHQHLGNFDDAERVYRRSIAVKRKALEPGHPSLARSYGNLASLLELVGRPDEADALFQESLAIQEASFGAGDARVTAEQSLLALRLESRGKVKEAEALLRKALGAAEARRGADHLELGERLMSLARFLVAQTRSAEAASPLERAIAIAEKAGEGGLELKSEALECRSEIAQQQRDLSAAEAFSLRALEAREAQAFASPVMLSLARLQYADLCFQLGRDAKAQLHYQRAWPAFDEDSTVADSVVVHLCLQLASLAHLLGEGSRAPLWAARALARLAAAEPPPPREVLEETLDLLEGAPAKSRGLWAKVGALVAGPRERPALWVGALESSLKEGRLRDARRLAGRAAELAAGDPALTARVEAAKGKLEEP
jgi:Tetratricopeptide repeat